MKKLFILIIAFTLLTASAVYAQTDLCIVKEVNVENTYTGTVHTKLTYTFACSGGTGNEQLTRMIIKVPYTDLVNVEAEDSYGTMAVLEGPAYIKATTTSTDTVVGVIFRKGLVAQTGESTYTVSISFDSNSLVTSTDSIKTIKPGNLVSNTKVTIVSTGLTETTIPVSIVNYKLNLPEGSSINQITPARCSFSESVVNCNALNLDEFKQIEIKWTYTEGVTGWGEKIKQYTEEVLPELNEIFKNWSIKFSEFLRNRGFGVK